MRAHTVLQTSRNIRHFDWPEYDPESIRAQLYGSSIPSVTNNTGHAVYIKPSCCKPVKPPNLTSPHPAVCKNCSITDESNPKGWSENVCMVHDLIQYNSLTHATISFYKGTRSIRIPFSCLVPTEHPSSQKTENVRKR